MSNRARYEGMSVPDMVRQKLGEESVDAAIDLGDEDALVVTPTRTLIYRGEGLIRDAAVEEYPHDAESVSISESRRKTVIRIDHGIDGESEFSVPTGRIEEILPSVLGGVLRANGVLPGDETVEEVYRLGELTIVLTEGRLLKHIGDAIWAEDAEEYDFESVTGLDTEEGEVSSQIIVELDGRPQRIKVPAQEARRIREQIERALLAYHDAASYGEFRRRRSDEADRAETDAEGDASDESADDGDSRGGIDFVAEGDGRDTTAVESDGATAAGGTAEEIAALRETVERQNELLESQQETIEQLIEELREL
jgi:hypothetical protein